MTDNITIIINKIICYFIMGVFNLKPYYLTVTQQTLNNMFKNPETTVYKNVKMPILKYRVKIVNMFEKNGLFFYNVLIYLEFPLL